MKGEVIYLYAFDVANEIVTSKVREILSQKPFPFEIRLDQAFPKDLPLYRPLAIQPPPLAETINHQPVHLLVRIYEVGVVSIAMRVAFDVKTLSDLHPFHKAVLDNGKTLDKVAQELCAEIHRNLREFMIKSSSPSQPEAYTLFCFTDLDGVQNTSTWLNSERRAIAGLLTQTSSERLSDAQLEEALRIQRSYENTDLVVIDWDAALVVDLTGYVEDVLYVLELANLQLEEFHMMDRNLDRYFNRVYEDLERSRFTLMGVSSRMLRSLRHIRVDEAKLADEVTHITKFFGDWYLARVYLGARDRFYLDHWRRSVEDRLTQLDKLYSVVHSEIYERRMLWLEIIIVVLFVIDLLALFLVRH